MKDLQENSQTKIELEMEEKPEQHGDQGALSLEPLIEDVNIPVGRHRPGNIATGVPVLLPGGSLRNR